MIYPASFVGNIGMEVTLKETTTIPTFRYQQVNLLRFVFMIRRYYSMSSTSG
jgi:hypothetical protein